MCTVVTVVGLGLRSPPTAETPEEADETKLQRVDGDIPKRKARNRVRSVIFGGGNVGVAPEQRGPMLEMVLLALVCVQPDRSHVSGVEDKELWDSKIPPALCLLKVIFLVGTSKVIKLLITAI